MVPQIKILKTFLDIGNTPRLTITKAFTLNALKNEINYY